MGKVKHNASHMADVNQQELFSPKYQMTYILGQSRCEGATPLLPSPRTP